MGTLKGTDPEGLWMDGLLGLGTSFCLAWREITGGGVAFSCWAQSGLVFTVGVTPGGCRTRHSLMA